MPIGKKQQASVGQVKRQKLIIDVSDDDMHIEDELPVFLGELPSDGSVGQDTVRWSQTWEADVPHFNNPSALPAMSVEEWPRAGGNSEYVIQPALADVCLLLGGPPIDMNIGSKSIPVDMCKETVCGVLLCGRGLDGVDVGSPVLGTQGLLLGEVSEVQCMIDALTMADNERLHERCKVIDRIKKLLT